MLCTSSLLISLVSDCRKTSDGNGDGGGRGGCCVLAAPETNPSAATGSIMAEIFKDYTSIGGQKCKTVYAFRLVKSTGILVFDLTSKSRHK